MKLVLLAVLLLAIGALALGCSDSSDTLTLEEYFAENEAIEADAGEQFGALYDGIPEDFDESDDANLPLVREFYASGAAIMRDSTRRTAELNPPAEAQDAHNELVAASENVAVVLERASDFVNEVETMAEITAAEVEFQPDIDAAFMRADEACFELVLIADANGITTSGCGDDD